VESILASADEVVKAPVVALKFVTPKVSQSLFLFQRHQTYTVLVRRKTKHKKRHH
jgi:hypothetical protein